MSGAASSTKSRGSGDLLIEGVWSIAQKLAIKAEKGVAKEDGRRIDFVLLHHGPHPVFAFDRGTYVQLAVIMDLDPKDSNLLAKQPKGIRDRLFTLLKVAMLQGRTGYNMALDGEKLKRIILEQRVVVAPNRQESIQRLLDGMQELVVLGVRCRMILGEAFSSVRETSTTSASPPPDGMYA